VLADLSDFPETLIVAGEIDPLYSDALGFFRKLERQGGTATFVSPPGMPHDFICFPWLDAAKAALEQVLRFQRDVLARAPSARTQRARAG
jgi:acetyl esterase/lipase